MYFFILSALALLSISLGAPTSQCPSETIQEAKKTETALANFAINLYKNVSAQDENKNQVISPVSVALAMALLENGADGETKQQIQNQLIKNEGTEEVLNVYHALLKNLQVNTPQAHLEVANGLFVDTGAKLHQDYQQSSQKCMEAEVNQLDFNKKPEEARKEINQWVAKKTMNKIKELFPQGSVDADTKLALANAIHFMASWEHAFEEQQTKSDEKVKVLEMKYEGIDTAMYTMLPKKKDGLKELEAGLNGDQLRGILQRVTGTQVRVQLPKFTVRSNVNLVQVLTNMGLKNLFNEGADFSKMVDQKLQISAAVHQAYINVHENGTEAAAATGFTFNRAAALGEKVEFVADHPFLYAIIHKPTGAALFVGKVNEVQEE